MMTTKEIVACIHNSGGRFLKFKNNDGMWEEISNSAAHDKVSHVLRTKAASYITGDNEQTSRIYTIEVLIITRPIGVALGYTVSSDVFISSIEKSQYAELKLYDTLVTIAGKTYTNYKDAGQLITSAKIPFLLKLKRDICAHYIGGT